MERPTIPIYDPRPEVDELWDELQAAIAGVLRSGQFIMGPNVLALEQEVAQYLGAKHAVALNSGTDALVIALRALDVGPGDEVITTPFTFFATAEAVNLVGATPVFVDIDPVTLNINPALVPAAITERTKAIIPVHLFGMPCEMDALMTIARTHNLRVVEDCAQSFGASYRGTRTGAIGDAGCLSFYPTKNLGAYGDGGMLITNDDRVAESARMLRSHGSRVKYQNEIVGYNSRLDEIQAAILRTKLPHVTDWNGMRNQIARRYSEMIDQHTKICLPQVPEWAEHSFHQYTVRVAGGRRDALRDSLKRAGIGTMVYYPVPVHRMPIFAEYPHLMVAERASQEVISLPMFPKLPPAEQTRICQLINTIL